MIINELTRVAYHEAGHAVMHFECRVQVKNISIVPCDNILGMVASVQTGPQDPFDIQFLLNQFLPSESFARKRIKILLAGKVAEGKILGHDVALREAVHSGFREFHAGKPIGEKIRLNGGFEVLFRSRNSHCHTPLYQEFPHSFNRQYATGREKPLKTIRSETKLQWSTQFPVNDFN